MMNYITNIIPRIRNKSKALDNIESLVDKPWLLIKDNGDHEKFMFKRDNTLIVSRQGNVVKAKWEYLDFDNSILIDFENSSLLLNQGFLYNGLMILTKDGTDEIHPFINQKVLANLELSRYLEQIEDVEYKVISEPIIQKYKKGVNITVHQQSPNINPGDKAFLNDHERLEDGKYKVGFMLYIIVKDGIVTRVK